MQDQALRWLTCLHCAAFCRGMRSQSSSRGKLANPQIFPMAVKADARETEKAVGDRDFCHEPQASSQVELQHRQMSTCGEVGERLSQSQGCSLGGGNVEAARRLRGSWDGCCVRMRLSAPHCTTTGHVMLRMAK